jgi:capsular polysaccharide biosynthesis protein
VDRLLVQRWWVVPAAAVAGTVVGVIISLAGTTDRRAEASVLISSPRGTAAVTPLLPNLRELATSSVLAGNVHSTLRLRESVEDLRRRLHAEVRPRSQVIVVSAIDAHADTARQLAQEAAVVFAQLVGARFGTATPPLQAAVLDSAHVLAAPNRHFLRNALIGSGAGLLLGAVALFLLGGGGGGLSSDASPALSRDLWKRELQLAQRVKAVTKRERQLASRAGQLAAQERKLAERASRLATEERELESRAKPEPAPSLEPVIVPEPEVTPVPVATVVGRVGAWNVNDLQRAVDARTGVAPEQADEWRTYLFFLREHAGSDGSLPSQFDSLIADVFGDVG